MIRTSELVAKIRLLLNEAEDDSDVTLLADDTRNLDKHIEMLLPEAVLFVQKNGRHAAVNPKSKAVADDEIMLLYERSGSFRLPSDFVKLVTLELDGWTRPCHYMYSADSPIAEAQSNKYTRAGWCKPLCVEGIDSMGEPCLQFHSLPPGVASHVKKFVYDALFEPEEGLSGNDEAVLKAVAYQCAALVYNVFERYDCANALLSVASALCNNAAAEDSGLKSDNLN